MTLPRSEALAAAKAEADATAERKKAQRIYRLASTSMGAAVVLSLALPVAGYTCTRRWRAMLLFLLIGGVILAATGHSEPPLGVLLLANLFAAIDNVLAIRRARNAYADVGVAG